MCGSIFAPISIKFLAEAAVVVGSSTPEASAPLILLYIAPPNRTTEMQSALEGGINASENDSEPRKVRDDLRSQLGEGKVRASRRINCVDDQKRGKEDDSCHKC